MNVAPHSPRTLPFRLPSPFVALFRSLLSSNPSLYPRCLSGKTLSDLHKSQVTTHKSRLFMCLRALELSCSFFAGPRPLFSIVCGLFDKNTRGGIPLPDFHEPRVTSRVSVSPLDSALTDTPPVTPLESALTKSPGGGAPSPTILSTHPARCLCGKSALSLWTARGTCSTIDTLLSQCRSRSPHAELQNSLVPQTLAPLGCVSKPDASNGAAIAPSRQCCLSRSHPRGHATPVARMSYTIFLSGRSWRLTQRSN